MPKSTRRSLRAMLNGVKELNIIHGGRIRGGDHTFVRRGIKWATRSKAFIKGHGVVDINTSVLPFHQLTDYTISGFTDPMCSKRAELFAFFRDECREFNAHESITLIRCSL